MCSSGGQTAAVPVEWGPVCAPSRCGGLPSAGQHRLGSRGGYVCSAVSGAGVFNVHSAQRAWAPVCEEGEEACCKRHGAAVQAHQCARVRQQGVAGMWGVGCGGCCGEKSMHVCLEGRPAAQNPSLHQL